MNKSLKHFLAIAVVASVAVSTELVSVSAAGARSRSNYYCPRGYDQDYRPNNSGQQDDFRSGYQRGVEDAREGYPSDYSRYYNEYDRRSESSFRQGYDQGFRSVRRDSYYDYNRSTSGDRRSRIQEDYYREGYRDGQSDNDANRRENYRRYSNRYDSRYESYYRDGYYDGYQGRQSRY